MKTGMCLFLILAALVLSACTPAAVALPESGKTPGAEMTPAAVSTDAKSGQTVTGKCIRGSDEVRLLINSVHRYCLQYPAEYDVFYPNASEMKLFKRSVLNVSEPSVSIKVQPADGMTVDQAADQFLAVYTFPESEMVRVSLIIDGEEAIMLDRLPGQEINRQVFVLHNEYLYQLTFLPMDESQPEVYAQAEALFYSVIGSFNFHPDSNACPDCPAPEALLPTGEGECSPAETLTSENGRIAYWGISFQLDPALATIVTVRNCQAVPYSDAGLMEPAHPAGLIFTFLTNLRRVYFQPQIAIYAVEGDMHLQDYPYPINALGDLETLLSERPEPSPWLGDSTLHVRAQYLDFASGAGVRLITQDAHDYNFYTNNNIFYNFDGLTHDGHFYVNVRVPVAAPFLMDVDIPGPLTNHNPNAIPIPTEWPRYGNQQLPIIDAYNQEALRHFDQVTDADFTPDLAPLDALVRSLEITAP